MASEHALQLADCYGLPVTTRSQEALQWYNRGLQGLLGFRQDTPDCFQRALALDPTFPMVWHLGLFLWEQGQYQRTMQLYREAFVDPATLIPPHLVDTVSLLWRLNLTGHPTPEEWRALTPSLETLRQARTYLFNQMHIALGLAGGRQLEWAMAYLDSLRARVRPDRPSLLGDVGVPLVEGMLAYVRGDYARAVECLSPIRQRIIDIGGSHAQREVFADILLDAALQTGAYDMASALIETKRRYRPERPLALFALEKVYAGQGNTAQAQATGAQARRLWQEMGADTA